MHIFLIHDYEAEKTVEVVANDFLSAISEHLPWPTIDVRVKWCPEDMAADIQDGITGSRYYVEKIS